MIDMASPEATPQRCRRATGQTIGLRSASRIGTTRLAGDRRETTISMNIEIKLQTQRYSRSTSVQQASLLRSGIRPRAACRQRRSSNANSFCGQNSAGIPGNLCELSKAYFATTFLSSSPPTPATQSGLCGAFIPFMGFASSAVCFNGRARRAERADCSGGAARISRACRLAAAPGAPRPALLHHRANSAQMLKVGAQVGRDATALEKFGRPKRGAPVSYRYSFEDLLALLHGHSPAKVDAVALHRRRVEHGHLSVGLKIHCLGDGSQFSTLVEGLGGAQKILDLNYYKHCHASLCLVLPPVGSAQLEGQYNRLPSVVDDLVRRRVDLIATPGLTVGAQAAKAATSTIPIVFGVSEDPGQVGSCRQPEPAGRQRDR
jgi:hypothetical protein